MRTALPSIAAALLLAACSGGEPQAPPAESNVTMEVPPSPAFSPSPVPLPSPDPTPSPEPTTVMEDVPDEVQVQEDADAVGMTSRVDRTETTEDQATAVEGSAEAK